MQRGCPGSRHGGGVGWGHLKEYWAEQKTCVVQTGHSGSQGHFSLPLHWLLLQQVLLCGGKMVTSRPPTVATQGKTSVVPTPTELTLGHTPLPCDFLPEARKRQDAHWHIRAAMNGGVHSSTEQGYWACHDSKSPSCHIPSKQSHTLLITDIREKSRLPWNIL